jgi:nucleotide-binding universal stress UspA family protein
MFKTILVPTDGSDLSEKAAHGAVDLAKLTGGRIIAISVAEPYPFTPLMEGAFTADLTLYDQQTQKLAQMHVDRVAKIAAKSGVTCEKLVAQSFNPYEEIIKAAKEHHCDLILMASHGRKGLSKLFVGSETQKVLADSTIPVMVFR